MPRETTRHHPRLQLLEGGLDFEIREQDDDVRVALSGTLDRKQLSRLIALTSPRLSRRGRRIVLEGTRLEHLDYRAVAALVDWARDLRAFGHRLMLSDWSTYLRTILVIGARPDWTSAVTAGPVAMRNGASAS